MEKHEEAYGVRSIGVDRTTARRRHGKEARQEGICGFGARLFRGGLPFAVCPKRYSLQEPKRDQTHTNRVNTNRKWMRGLWEGGDEPGP